MKQNFFSAALLAILMVVQPSFAQKTNELLLADAQNSLVMTALSAQKASFPSLERYLKTNLRYPALAQKNCVEGTVIVEALIDAEGAVQSVGLVKGIGFGCDQALLELVSNMPHWTPAKENGRFMSQKVLIRTQFRLK
jgi:TonB family protein